MKKLLSSFLALCLLLCTVTAAPLPAFSAADSEFEYTVAAGQATVEAYTGTDTAPVIPDTLDGYPVTGIGNEAFSNDETLTGVTLPSGVTAIGDYAFEGCTALRAITLPDSLRSLGGFVFAGCSSLQQLTIPAAVTSIGIGLLDSCPSLTTITVSEENTKYNSNGNCNAIIETTKKKLLAGCQTTVIPDGIKIIEMYAFRGCTGLTAIAVPDSVDSLGQYAFCGCSSLKSVQLPAALTNIPFRCFYGCESLTDIILPDALTSIENYAFYGCAGLKQLSLPSGVTAIGYSAFRGCTGLTELVLPDGLTAVSNYAFRDCTALTALTLPNSVTTVSANAFYGCSSLSRVNYLGTVSEWLDVTVETGNEALQTANRYFYPAEDYTYTVSDGVATVTGYSGAETNLYLPPTLGGAPVQGIAAGAFADLTGLKSVVIPSTITQIGAGAFSGCSAMTAMTVSPYNTVYDSRDNCNAIVETATDTLIAGCKTTVIGDSITTVGEQAFAGCTGLVRLALPLSVIGINDSAFNGCTGLNTVFYTGTESELGQITVGLHNDPFLAATKICNNGFSFTVDGDTATVIGYQGDETEIVIPSVYDGHSVTAIGARAFYRSAVTGVTLPSSIVSIGEFAFSSCNSLSAVTIPENVTSIGTGAFEGCRSLTAISVNRDNTVYDSREDCQAIVETATDTLVAGCQNTVIPDSVTAIGSYAFRNCTGLTALTVPENVSEIGDYAFSGCTGLTELVLPDGVTSVNYRTFYECTALQNIVIPDSVTAIGEDAFYGCTALAEVAIPHSVGSIGDYAFYRAGLTAVDFQNGLVSIGERAFYGCAGLLGVAIPDTVTSIGSAAFSDCTALTAITVGANNTVYDSREDCQAIIETATDTLLVGCGRTVIPETVKAIAMNAFKGCVGLERLVLPNGLTAIGEAAFYGCADLSEVTLPESLTTLDDLLFYQCSSLKTVSFYDSMTAIGRRTFYGCNALETVNFFGTKEAFESITVEMMNTPLMNATKHYFPTEAVTVVPATPNERGYDAYTCTECGVTYIDHYTPFASDDSALQEVISRLGLLNPADYEEGSFAELTDMAQQASKLAAGKDPQYMIDAATEALLSGIGALVPYLNLQLFAENGRYDITVDEEYLEGLADEAFENEPFGTLIELTAVPDSGYTFKGWYETNSHRIFSTDAAYYAFTLTSNTSLRALFVPEDAAVLYCQNDSGYIKEYMIKTREEWAAVTADGLAALLPEVPYRYGSVDGHWAYDAQEVLSSLQDGEDVVITAAYTDLARPDEAQLPTANENGTPSLQLTGAYDGANDVYTFVLGAGLAEDSSIVSVGIAFCYGKPSRFHPEEIFVTLNNKMLTSKFEAAAESGYYLVNVRRFSGYSWAARGYVTYYDSYGELRTAYAEQLNIDGSSLR